MEQHQLSGRTSLEPPSWCTPTTVPILPPMCLQGELSKHLCKHVPSQLYFLHSCTRLDLDPAGLFNSSLFSCYIQILAGRLSTYGGGGHLCQPAVQGANGSPIYGQVCYFCKDEWGTWGTPALLLHDRWQDGQNSGAARKLHRGGPESRHWGAHRGKATESQLVKESSWTCDSF